MAFVTILLSFLVADTAWWIWAHRRLRRAGVGRVGRILLGLFMGFQVAGYVAVIGLRMARVSVELPVPLMTAVYIWHLVVLPLTVILSSLWSVGATAGRLIKRRATEPTTEGPSRRSVLTAAAVATPPLLSLGASGVGLVQRARFRIRPLTIALPGLPPALDGLSIAHVSDTHVGKFTNGDKLGRIAAAVNGLDADLVLVTGDLIDFNIADLPDAIRMVRQFKSRHGTFLCEGNHDLFQGRDAFERGVKQAGLRLLVNDSAMTSIRGQNVQLLGMKWGGGANRRDPGLASHMATLKPMLHATAFPILLAHHPHAFDEAAAAGIPLTLAGHTHGGQLMLRENVGPGPMMYKYWSGLYQKPGAACVVSNGVGNWFPLRVNAPAEIVHVRLTRA